MQAAPVGQHCQGARKPAFHKVLGERLSRVLERLLEYRRDRPSVPATLSRSKSVSLKRRAISARIALTRAAFTPRFATSFCGFGGRPERLRPPLSGQCGWRLSAIAETLGPRLARKQTAPVKTETWRREANMAAAFESGKGD